MLSMPTGTVTFLFTDIEGSTTRWEQQRQAMQRALARHDAIMREAIEAHGGHVFKTVGDAFCAAFARPGDALDSALAIQRAIESEPWSAETGPLRVRMALHSGVASERDNDYFGPPLNRVARLLSTGHGGQVLLSHVTYGLVRDALPPDVGLRDLGEHRLKDLSHPERIFQVVAADRPADFAPLRTLDHRPNNLPPQPSPLVGREQDVAAARSRVMRDEVRIVTLTGPGGTGKTRVALQVAAELTEDFADGVWFVDLAPITDAALVLSTIATTLGARETGTQSSTEMLKAYLRPKQLLLVLDNFEQVLAAAPSVMEVLAAAPGVKALVTSREALRVRGEREYPLAPLPVPDRAVLPPPDELLRYDAVRLFVERAQDVRPDFALTELNARSVAEICRRLDGLPLAIELAAARVKLLTPDALLRRLEHPLKLLTGGARDVHVRQQTLRATIDWSYNLLESDEQTLFRRLGVFVGGCTIDAVDTVCGADDDTAVDAFDGIASLVDKSLVRPVEVRDGTSRFTMLETVREYALERLEASEEAETLRRRHSAFYLARAEAAAAEMDERSGYWGPVLEDEHDNLRAALRRALAAGEIAPGTQLIVALWPFWQRRGYSGEGLRWLEAIWPYKNMLPPSLLACALHAAGELAWSRGAVEEAIPWLQESLALFRDLDDTRGAALVLGCLGRAHVYRDGPVVSIQLLQESLALFRLLDDKPQIARMLAAIGMATSYTGDHNQAIEMLDEAVAVCRRTGYKRVMPAALRTLGFLVFAQGDEIRGRTLFEQSVAVSRELGDIMELANSLFALARAERWHGAYPAAVAHYEESAALYRQMMDGTPDRELLFVEFGLIAVAQDRLTEAENYLHHSLVLLQSDDEWYTADYTLTGFAALAASRQQLERAATLLGAVDRANEQQQTFTNVLDRRDTELVAADVRSRLDEQTFETAWARGRAMSIKDAVVYAGEGLVRPGPPA